MPLELRLATLSVVLFSAANIAIASEGLSPNYWRYSTSDQIRPTARSISLTEERPQDFEEEASYRGKSRRYAQLRYGSENSRRVVVVVDDLGNKQYDFYIDQDRDRIVSNDDRIDGQGRERFVDLDTEIIREDLPEQMARRIQLRLSSTGKRMSVATVGYIEGAIRWDSERRENVLQVRRVDGNANGLFADARDRLLIDVDGNGEWDPIKEQFAYLPVLKVDDRRYAVHSDRLGERFSLSEINGVGSLRVVVDSLPEAASMMAFEAMIFSEDGSAYALRQADQPISVPVGKYTLGSVTMTIDAGERDPWHFVFSRNDSIEEDQWTAVETDADVALEAVGQTRFDLGMNDDEAARPGKNVVVRPRLYTHQGLLINLSARGRQMGSFDRERFHNCCQIDLRTKSGKKVGGTKSGFA